MVGKAIHTRAFGILCVGLLLAGLTGSGNGASNADKPRDWVSQRMIMVADAAGVALPETFEELMDYAGVAGDTGTDDGLCLATAIYFEARGESIDGQVAVGKVILNRVADKRYPSTICGVVFQNERWRNRCQFSFACDGQSDKPLEREAWMMARRIANLVKASWVPDTSGAATHYHATYVSPRWRTALKQTVQVGQHVFYREGLRR